MIDNRGFRAGVAMVIINDKKRVFWAKRIQQNAWQFPQGGILHHETPAEAMYRELYEEIGLQPEDVELLATSKEWLKYYLPHRMIRNHSRPLCVGQCQKWFLLKLKAPEETICFNSTQAPEFDGFRWVNYWLPLRRVIAFKRSVYRQALQEFAQHLFDRNNTIDYSIISYDEHLNDSLSGDK
ncbi:MAG: RNA pyrophosphohydrolase [Gammaproteobacteria bacterium GWE2_42_36]|nr:MAG: RNA pyrophosphohydrolase [Gammaproteobacteria bacterium GWE2_42_36]HCU04763.1 RNA pyrophosphohydrolase [Coxiellaceae bacterium]